MGIYYKIYQTESGMLTVVSLCWTDELGYYDSNRFFTDDNGDDLKFKTEDEAGKWLNDNIKVEFIDPEYRKVKFNREAYLK